MTVFAELDALGGLSHYFATAPDKANKAASLALNQAADRYGLKRSRDLMNEQVAFPAGYLSPGEGRFYISEKATPTKLSVTILARFRPTSLLRFAQFTAGTTEPTVTIDPGKKTPIKGAFRVNLRSGNQGLAIRLKKGVTALHGRYSAPVVLGKGLVLLYGPSVDQVFREVSAEVGPGLLEATSAEFFRQWVRFSGSAFD